MAEPVPISQLVAVGASAGGIEALCTLVATLPSPFPAPIVVAQHLDPSRPSQLQAILARRSTLPVHLAADSEPLEAGVIYVVPSNRHVRIADHHLTMEPDGGEGPKPSIDLLFQTAAEVFGEGLIAVVLTGMGSDGAAGARRVKEAGGTVVIQNPRTATYPSMPLALVPTTVDAVAEVANMGPLLHDLLTGAYTPSSPGEDRQVQAFLEEVRAHSGIDFGRYKTPTIQRRLQRRLLATGTRNLEEYRAYLERHREEYGRLVNSFLVKVTEFFRDADVYAALRDQVLPELIAKGREHGNELRLWSAGCATGEEAYSLALLVAEALGGELEEWSVRIFATDLDSEAVSFARRGVYPESALREVPVKLRARYFHAEDSTYMVRKAVRGMLVFGEHDLGQRPPFPHIDLALCRNVLIYFTPELQQRALALFAFAVRPGGYLVLGRAESARPVAQYFASVDPTVRLYRRQGDELPALPPADRMGRLPIRSGRQPALAAELAKVRRRAQEEQEARLAAEQLLLQLPIGVVVVDHRYDIRRINGAARRLLGIHTAALGEDLLHLAHSIPSTELRAAVDAALAGEERTLDPVPTDVAAPGERRFLRLICRPQRPLQEERGAAVLLVLDCTGEVRAQQAAGAESRAAQQAADAESRAAQLEIARLTGMLEQVTATSRQLLAANEELSAANTMLQTASEDAVISGEEIQAASEEVETLNEELQASNEELEVLNEEQRATVEELEMTNDEMRTRNREVQALADALDLQRRRLAAILGGMGDAVVVLDKSGKVVFSSALFDQLFGSRGIAFVPQDEDGHLLPEDNWPQRRALRGEAFRMQFTLDVVDGQRRRYEVSGRPIREDGIEEDALLVFRDTGDGLSQRRG